MKPKEMSSHILKQQKKPKLLSQFLLESIYEIAEYLKQLTDLIEESEAEDRKMRSQTNKKAPRIKKRKASKG